MRSIDYWKMSEKLSVVDSAILISDNDPSEFSSISKERYNVSILEFEGVFKALTTAIKFNSLKAWVTVQVIYVSEKPTPPADTPQSTREVEFMNLLMTTSQRDPEEKRDLLDLKNVTFIEGSLPPLIYKSKSMKVEGIDWNKTIIDVEDLKEWLIRRKTYPPVFFGDSPEEEFRNRSNPRYSAKLACAIAAWEAVEVAKPNQSIKQTLQRWITENAATFGLVDRSGKPIKSAVEQIATVVNWNISGGAVPISKPVSIASTPRMQGSSDELGEQFEKKPDPRTLIDDDEIPF